MNSTLYKFILCTVVALCAWEALDYLFNATPPNSDIAFIALVISVWLLLERLFIILIVDQVHRSKT